MRACALAIFLLALAIRLLAVDQMTYDPMLDIDQSEYLALAQNMRSHGTLSYGRPYHWGDPGTLNAPGPFEPTAARAPLYPALVALLWHGTSPPITETRVVQALLGAGTALFVFLIALRFFGLPTATIAGTAMALAPASILLSVALYSESLCIFLLTLATWFWGRGQGVLAGVAFGLAALARAVVLPFIVVLALLSVVWRHNRALHLRIVLCAVLVIAPWTVRNMVTQHRFIPVATLGWGANLFLGTIDTEYGKDTVWTAVERDPEYKRILQGASSEVDAERHLFDAALARVAADPMHWLGVRLRQYPRLFVQSPSYLYPYVPLPTLVIRIAYLAGTVLFMGLAAWGTVRALRRWPQTYHLAAFPLFILAAQIPFLTDERYGLPMVPMFVVFAALSLTPSMSLNRKAQTR
jgi:4-amino-4-deoxy-L-arabinose transferase-like glycosyltransferase